ncbi:hypothetical protein Cs7R123_11410 [Catellatospora sp. TT07R-123]|uniref:tetratricopeptide repeat protein n=1 Tax=Catellatospora sp. TT07R-123 TaxID=2733863 RepID=UPI001B2E3118|nr:tetratricopeptide repeat protein [Catellatospora sp. TT07R-123]GHJ43799.1 hypothetical protein Cs7R123_11410 [Catellatospora sp. TT07R-123]
MSDDVEDDLRRAEALLSVGRHDAAGEVLARVLARRPDSYQALCQLARVEFERGDYAAMLAAADAAVAAAPGSDWAHRLRSMALRHSGRVAAAAGAAAEAVRLAPGNWACHVSVASCELAYPSESGVRAAYRAAARAVVLAPHQPDTHLTLGRVHAAAFDSPNAQACYGRALALDPDFVAARNDLAVEQLRTGRYSAAGRQLIDVLAGDPHLKVVQHNLGLAVRAWLGRWADLAAAAWVVVLVLTMTLDNTVDRVASGVLAAALGAGAVWSYRRLPATMRRMVRRRPGRGEFALAMVWVSSVLLFAGLVVRAVAATDGLRSAAGLLVVFAVGRVFATGVRAYHRLFEAAHRRTRRWRHRAFLRRHAAEPGFAAELAPGRGAGLSARVRMVPPTALTWGSVAVIVLILVAVRVVRML